MDNEQISKLLRNIATAYTIKNEKKFRFQIIAYQKASDTIKNLTSEIKEYYKEDRLDELSGIGTSIRGHLIELFQKVRVKQFEWALKDIPQSVFVLIDVPGFGPKRAYKLVNEFNLTNPKTAIEDLEKIAEQGKIASLSGFGEKSQSDIIRSISEFRLGKGKTTKMILPYALEIAEKIIEYLKTCRDVKKAEPVGSLRRKSPTVGDIDIAVASYNPESVISHFISYPHKERVMEKGDITASMLVSGGRQVDLMVQPPESFGSLLQHFTGSKSHNIALREFAIKKGLSLSEYGIKSGRYKKIRKYDTEERFYDALEADWIPPEIRENTGEIELAVSHKLPQLIELGDIKGDLHIHSSFPIEPSHDLGKNSIEEMLNKAKGLNYEYFGFSEHNPSISKHTNSQVYALISKRNAEIEQIKLKTKSIRILKLLEVDILPSGKLAIDNKSLDVLDAVIVSVHSVFKMGKQDMTKRVISGLSHKKAKILAHPTGRMLNERPGYELDFHKIFEFCVKNDKALEINCWPTRLDLPDILIQQAIQNNVKLIINTDSHSTSDMNLMKYGVSMARRGWAKKSDMLNTLGYNDFIKWLRG